MAGTRVTTMLTSARGSGRARSASTAFTTRTPSASASAPTNEASAITTTQTMSPLESRRSQRDFGAAGGVWINAASAAHCAGLRRTRGERLHRGAGSIPGTRPLWDVSIVAISVSPGKCRVREAVYGGVQRRTSDIYWLDMAIILT